MSQIKIAFFEIDGDEKKYIKRKFDKNFILEFYK